MRRSWIAVAVLALALGGGELLAGKGGGGKKPPVDPPPPDPAIAYELGDDLYVMNADGSNVTLLLAADEAGGNIREPSWSPDGTQLAFKVTDDSSAGLYTLEVNVDSDGVSGSGLTYLTAMARSGSGGVSWSPVAVYGVHRIAFRDIPEFGTPGSSHLYIINADGTGGRTFLNRQGSYFDSSGISWSPSGDRIAVARGTYGIRVHTLAVATGGDVYVSDSSGYDLGVKVFFVAWSKTQDDVLVVSVPNPSSADLWEIDLADAIATSDPEVFLLSDHMNLTNSRMDDLYPSWSPDDTRIVWRSAGRGSPDGILVLDVDGSADPTLLLKDGKAGKPYRPAWRRNP
ncbi:MAG: TolB family protein [Planctomycetota bacterium]|jgi:Tol biopolymer transport system component